MINIIDPHLHLFDLTRGDYHWLKPENPPFWPDKSTICRSFSSEDIQLHPPLKLRGFVHIEAGFDNQHPINEISYLQQTVPISYRAIAFADITAEPVAFSHMIEVLLQSQHVVGVRYIFDHNAVDILSSPAIHANFLLLADKGLIFECQMPLADKKAVTLLCVLLSQIPRLKIIINHVGSPTGEDKSEQANCWYQGLLALSAFSTVAIKCSGWEMVSRSYSHHWLKNMVLTCVDVFGEHRVMLASNFPLCLFSTSYQNYWQQLVNVIPNSLFNNLCYMNAKKWYNVE